MGENSWQMVLFGVGLVLLIGYGVLIHWYRWGWLGLKPFVEPPGWEKRIVSVTLLIAARNEAHSLPALLRGLELQSYPSHLLQILLLEDHSTDGTGELAKAYRLSNLTVVAVGGDAETSSKKKAIAEGVAIATGELIVCTDADCVHPPRWIETMVDFYAATGAQFVAAPVRFEQDVSLLSVFQTLDFMTLQGITASSVSTRFHAMANGANLAYTKKAFEAVDGFAGIDSVASGDDMLLMHKIWQRYPDGVHYLLSPEAVVSTAPMPTWRSFVAQRIRWASKTQHYRDRRVFWSLVWVYFFNLWFVATAVASLFSPSLGRGLLLVGVLKTAVELQFLHPVAGFYGQRCLLWWFPFLQPLHILYVAVIGLWSQVGKYEWKGRRVK